MSSGAKPIETAARQRLRLSGCIDHRCHGGLGAACPLINCFPVLGEPNGDKAFRLAGIHTDLCREIVGSFGWAETLAQQMKRFSRRRCSCRLNEQNMFVAS
jgi:hypothetical protein